MGGDNAPEANVQGALAALRAYPDLRICLTGREADIRACLGEHADVAGRLQVFHAPDVIGMHEAPVMAVRRKPHSSLVEGMLMVRAGEADALVSAGSTGAVLAGGMFRVGRIEGIDRPVLAAQLPMRAGPSLLVDTGANVDCQPEWLVQFALMGSVYMQKVVGVPDPQVALINIGTEEEKGNDLAKRAHALLSAGQPFRFIGNVEARDLPEGVADVLVTDGYVGNVVLKFMEGMAKTLFALIKDGLMSSLPGKVAGVLAKPVFRRIKATMDATEAGGAPLLGVEGVLVKAHGNSNARAMFCAIRQARIMVENQVVRCIREGVRELAQGPAQPDA
jgi:glycerol-3-phosphate acyltransferase PlsX